MSTTFQPATTVQPTYTTTTTTTQPAAHDAFAGFLAQNHTITTINTYGAPVQEQPVARAPIQEQPVARAPAYVPPQGQLYDKVTPGAEQDYNKSTFNYYYRQPHMNPGEYVAPPPPAPEPVEIPVQRVVEPVNASVYSEDVELKTYEGDYHDARCTLI